MTKVKTGKRVINKQKVFWAISIAFLFACVLFYGTRLIYFYNKFKIKDNGSDNSFYDIIWMCKKRNAEPDSL